MPMAAAIGRRRTPDLLREYMRQRRLAGEIATRGDLRQTQVRTRQVLLHQIQAEVNVLLAPPFGHFLYAPERAVPRDDIRLQCGSPCSHYTFILV